MESFKLLLSYLGRADVGAGMLLELGKVVSGVITVASHIHMLSDSK